MSLDHAEVSEPPVVQRWKRYGHDRAYVKVADRDLGYCDLRTGDVHCADPADLAEVTRATAGTLARVQAEAAPDYVPRHSAPDSEPVPTASPSLLPDRDLAANRPGQAARERALELRDAAPVRTFFNRVVGAKTDERAWRIGADAEAEVARRLLALDADWHVLHAVPVGDRGSDIDHVVIGPGGVFTVNTKNHPDASVWVGGDTVKVNGHNQPYVRKSRHEAQRAARLLSAAAGFDVEVHGIVAVMGAQRGFTVKEQPRDGAVTLLTRKKLAGHLKGRPVVLGVPSVTRILEVARHLATWQPRTVQWDASLLRT